MSSGDITHPHLEFDLRAENHCLPGFRIKGPVGGCDVGVEVTIDYIKIHGRCIDFLVEPDFEHLDVGFQNSARDNPVIRIHQSSGHRIYGCSAKPFLVSAKQRRLSVREPFLFNPGLNMVELGCIISIEVGCRQRKSARLVLVASVGAGQKQPGRRMHQAC